VLCDPSLLHVVDLVAWPAGDLSVCVNQGECAVPECDTPAWRPGHIDVDEGVVETVREYTGGKGVEYLIEASGSGAVFRSIPGLICKQATVLLYGHGHSGADVSVFSSILFKEPVLVSSAGASGGFEADGRPAVYVRALSLIERKQIAVGPLITHRYKSLAGVETALSHEIHSPDYVKGVVVLPIADCQLPT